MKRHPPHMIWLVALALIGQGVVPGLVLCTEASGHVELELARAGCCDDPASSPTTAGLIAGAISRADGNDCGPCTDTAVSTAPIAKTKSHNCDVALTVTGDVASHESATAPVATTRAPNPRVKHIPTHTTRLLF